VRGTAHDKAEYRADAISQIEKALALTPDNRKAFLQRELDKLKNDEQ